jgi:hypothetical protein
MTAAQVGVRKKLISRSGPLSHVESCVGFARLTLISMQQSLGVAQTLLGVAQLRLGFARLRLRAARRKQFAKEMPVSKF